MDNFIIYKYELQINPDSTCSVELPQGAEILYVNAQIQPEHNNTVGYYVWATHNKTVTEKTTRTIALIGTGQDYEIDEFHRLDRLGSFMDRGFVWHVFELITL